MILNYLSPNFLYKTLIKNVTDLFNYLKYRKIIEELKESNKLEVIGFSIDANYNLYIGIDLNPELLLYSDLSQESVELKLISEKIKKYTDFLTKEGILDYVKVEYDRVKNEEYYGYILQIKYDFKNYKLSTLTYSILYFLTIIGGLGAVVFSLL